MKTLIFLLLSSLVLVLSACDNKSTLPPPVGLNEQQAKLFAQSCAICHASSSNPAPQVGDKAAWNKRLEQGLPTLVQHAMQGFNSMPAGGLCTTCTPPDFEAMIVYMATAQTKK
ncbi:MAG: cytochrome c5 family protein [Agitococcus sp.]|jgi:cytochrome c5|nr:cytochrome c5 family protein [Agitococcus sp.]HQV79796.1 c-type cytochrome [Agitococcus sp.]